MNLVKGAWRLLVGVKDGLVLLFMLLFFGILFAALSFSSKPSASKGGALLLSLKGTIVEQPEAPDLRSVLSGQLPAPEYRLRDVVGAIEAAAKDSSIKTVVLDLDSFAGGGQTALSRVGAALDRVKAAKKPVLAFATGYSDDAYQLAAHADEIWLDPMGGVLFAGPGGSQLYFKGLIDRLGANVHVYRVGKYKSFIEPYTRADQSPEAKSAIQAVVNSLWGQWQAEVSKARPQAKLAAMISDPAGSVTANGNSLSKTALAAGIVDKLADKAAFGVRVAKIAGSEDKSPAGSFNSTELTDYIAANRPSPFGQAIGIVTVAGSIVDGEARQGTAGGATIANLIRKAIAKDDLKALVVRVDSGGGSALASEHIRQALAEAKAKGIPIVSSMGNVAASGGYWVAMAGDRVFAEPSTITGSIGVFAVLPTFENVVSKYGVTADGVKTTPLSGQPDLFKGTNAATDTIFQAGVEDIYSRFLSLVATARHMPIEKVSEIAQGRVWDGAAAKEIGLIDAFGSLDDAVAEAAKIAKLDPANVQRRYLEPEPSVVASWIASASETRVGTAPQDMFGQLVRQQQQSVFSGLFEVQAMIAAPSVQARCLECPLPARGLPEASFLSTFFAKVLS
ncbi:MAG: signal peptide peptidase SppA [Sphingomonadaceae bacterium]